MMKTTAPYGTWESPVSSTLVAHSISLPRQVIVDGDHVYWIVSRPQEGGRNVILRYSGENDACVTPPEFNVRTRVHEYGGGSYFVSAGTIYFCNYADQRLYRQQAGRAPEPITPEPAFPGALRYAAMRMALDNKTLVCVRERHTSDGQVVNELVKLPADGSSDPEIIAAGHDFYGYPRFSPDGTRLAFVTWDHPNMPWDGTELWVGEFVDGDLANIVKVAGGSSESIFQPEWSKHGILHFISDRTGWWNLYAYDQGSIVSLYEREADFGTPQWLLEFSTYTILPDSRIVCIYHEAGAFCAGILEPRSGKFHEVPGPFTAFNAPSIQSDSRGQVWCLAGSYTTEPGLVKLNPDNGEWDVVQRKTFPGIEPEFISIPEHLSYPSAGGRQSHTYFYPPTNPDFEAPADEKPPLVVLSHGGPTAAARPHFQAEIQFWTTRGFAVADVNYGGSTGYGRAYRDLLKGTWGIVDVEDCVHAALYLAGEGKVDRDRLLIRGGSAGGYVTLCALTFFDVFTAGASYYGIADAAILAQHTHKFEERYLDSLIGPFPEEEALYHQRSPIYHTDQLSSPVILFQGLEDEVVHPEQSQILADALREKGIPYAYLAFAGEQHGFRRAETIQQCLDAELYFYARILGFTIPAGIKEIEIYNLK